MSAVAILALVSGMLCALAPLAQAARVRETGSARDVSLIWLSLYATGSAIWVGYGIGIASLPLVVSQSTAFISSGVALGLVARYRRCAHETGMPSGRSSRAVEERYASGTSRQGIRSRPGSGPGVSMDEKRSRRP